MSTFDTSTDDKPGAGHQTHTFVVRAGFVLTLGMIVVSCLMAFSGPANQNPQIGIGVTSFLVYTASISGGAFLGFLFGLPRARVIDQLTPPQTAETRGSQQQAPWQTQFLTNSNLIKVSDWLTTIIIGLTLVNLGQIVPGVRELGDVLSAPLGGFPYSAAMGVAVATGSVLAGFLLAYLWTSIRVRELLEEAEVRARLMNETGRKKMADLIGKTVDQARSVAAHLGIHLDVPPNAEGTSTIIDQDKDPGTPIAPGDEITVKTS